MQWSGADSVDAPPLPLPPLSEPVEVTLVRHGESTWNAERRIQGSSNRSELTAKGRLQAAAARGVLCCAELDACFCSPLRRAEQTAAVVWLGAPPTRLDSLREVDLGRLEGLLKADAALEAGPAWDDWRRRPASFELDGRAPVRELWYRASVAWGQVLGVVMPETRLLVVAHNATNQALLGSACGWGPSLFRRFLQSNGHATQLRFAPAPRPGDPALASLLRMNVGADGWAARIAAGIILLVAAERDGTEASATILSRFARGPSVHLLYVPGVEAHAMAARLAAGLGTVARETDEKIAWGAAEAAGLEGGEREHCTVLVGDTEVLARILCRALGLPAECASAIALEPGGVSVLRPEPAGGWATAHCINDQNR